MEITMLVGTAYAVLYVLWLLVIIVSGIPERWIGTTFFFVVTPFLAMLICAIFLITMFVAPFIYFFSAKARQEFRDKLRGNSI